MLTTQEALVILLAYSLIMISLGVWTSSKKETLDHFLLMDRNLGGISGAISIAVSWIWAPAVFICSLKSFTQGLPGIFWFTLPNIVCFFTFAVIALKIRSKFKNGYSLPDFLAHRFKKDLRVHKASLFIFFGYQLGAIIINSLAGGTLLSLLTGLNIYIAIFSLSFVALIYSLLGGLSASVVTDKLQMGLIVFVSFILVPWVVLESGGIENLASGLGGNTGAYTNIFDPMIAYSFGIAATVSLISGPVADQMFYQRSFAVRQSDILKVFIIGGLLFGIVPITLSILGFVGAAPDVLSQINVTDPQMIGPIVIDHFLPKWALMAFVVLAFAGLSSTLDSAYAAISSLGSIDVFKKYAPDHKSLSALSAARISMVIFFLLGTGIAMMNPKLLWVFLIYGALASGILVPIIFSVFSETVSANAVFWSILFSIIFVLPLSIYANTTENVDIIVLSSFFAPMIGTIICTASVINSKNKSLKKS